MFFLYENNKKLIVFFHDPKKSTVITKAIKIKQSKENVYYYY